MAKAAARHILVKTKDEAESIKQQLANGADFGKLAKNIPSVVRQRKAAILESLDPARWSRLLTTLYSKTSFKSAWPS